MAVPFSNFLKVWNVQNSVEIVLWIFKYLDHDQVSDRQLFSPELFTLCTGKFLK